MIPGIDVSKYDVKMNWAAYTFPYAFIKVSEGTVIDPLFTWHWNNAKGKTYRGAYHFFRPSIDPKTSVLKTLEFLGNDIGELPLMFDLEATDGRGDVMSRAKSWLSWYEAETQVRPIIYSSLGFLVDQSLNQNIWLQNYKLHLAQYRYDNLSVDVRARILRQILKGEVAYTYPAMPSPFRAMPFVQWTAKAAPEDIPGYYTGIGGKLAVDVNFYNGNVEQMRSEFGITPVEPPVEPPTKEPLTLRLSRGSKILLEEIIDDD